MVHVTETDRCQAVNTCRSIYVSALGFGSYMYLGIYRDFQQHFSNFAGVGFICGGIQEYQENTTDMSQIADKLHYRPQLAMSGNSTVYG